MPNGNYFSLRAAAVVRQQPQVATRLPTSTSLKRAVFPRMPHCKGRTIPSASAQQRLTIMSTSATTNDLLAGPPPRITRTDIDFAQTELSGYAGLYAVLLDNVLTPAECAALIGAAEATTNGVWEKALINVGNGKQRAAPEARNSDRIIWDDADMVERLWRRVEPWVPELKVLGPGCPAIRPAKPGKEQWWRATRYFHSLRDEGVLTTMAIRLNERMRILRYGPGEYFRRKQSLHRPILHLSMPSVR